MPVQCYKYDLGVNFVNMFMAGAREGVVLFPSVWTSWVIMGSRSMEHVGETELPDPLVFDELALGLLT